MTPISRPTVAFGPDGLAPAIVQDASSGRVLMLAWMDAESLDATVDTGEVHFHSRSRDRLWRKGEISGNVLRLRGLATDCDSDAVLITVDPAGPTCHRGTTSCFDPEDAAMATAMPASAIPPSGAAAPATRAPAAPAQGFDFFEELWATIERRVADPPPDSYTARLIGGGVDAVARKVTEEATEVLLAARDDAEAEARDDAVPTSRRTDRGSDRPKTQDALAGETADLVYHALVLLAERGLAPSAVIETLRGRHRP